MLMIDAGIPDLPSGRHAQILGKLNERFMPGLSNDEAKERFCGFIDMSVESELAEYLEHFHKWHVYWQN